MKIMKTVYISDVYSSTLYTSNILTGYFTYSNALYPPISEKCSSQSKGSDIDMDYPACGNEDIRYIRGEKVLTTICLITVIL